MELEIISTQEHFMFFPSTRKRFLTTRGDTSIVSDKRSNKNAKKWQHTWGGGGESSGTVL
uniref:Uncharacterized protein n=1 Tax=Anguilla anguilla TaxID=7936 RepID=A0A0E9TZQ1_ANGAN